MPTLIKKALDEYVQTHSNTVHRKSDVAPLMGVTGQDLAAFFSGEKLLTIETVTKIATFLGVQVSDAVLEHVDSIKKYYEERK